ncbi:MAG: hypothetical protein LWW87_04865 [Geobacteraceae bacterium]|nr:hypothetical protein [Geobacteraceae bacterium]
MGIRLVVIMIVLSISAGCAAKRPVLYPNELYRSTGPERAQQEIDDCLKRAEEANAQGRLADEVALKTGKSALVGGATGAVVGAISGSALRGGLIGAAAGGTVALVSSAMKGPEDSPVYRRFVELCLSEKGYQVLGWQ